MTPQPLTPTESAAIALRRSHVRDRLLTDFTNHNYNLMVSTSQPGHAAHAYNMSLGKLAVIGDGRQLLRRSAMVPFARAMSLPARSLYSIVEDDSVTTRALTTAMANNVHVPSFDAAGHLTLTPAAITDLPSIADQSDISVLEWLGLAGGENPATTDPSILDGVVASTTGALTPEQIDTIATTQQELLTIIREDFLAPSYMVRRLTSTRGEIMHQRLVNLVRVMISFGGRLLLTPEIVTMLRNELAVPNSLFLSKMNEAAWLAIENEMRFSLYQVNMPANGDAWTPSVVLTSAIPAMYFVTAQQMWEALGMTGGEINWNNHAPPLSVPDDEDAVAPAGELASGQLMVIEEWQERLIDHLRDEVGSESYPAVAGDGTPGAGMERTLVSLGAVAMAGDGRHLLNSVVKRAVVNVLEHPSRVFSARADINRWSPNWTATNANLNSVDAEHEGGWRPSPVAEGLTPGLSEITPTEVFTRVGIGGGSHGYAEHHDPLAPPSIETETRIQSVISQYTSEVDRSWVPEGTSDIPYLIFNRWTRTWIGAAWDWHNNPTSRVVVTADGVMEAALARDYLVQWVLDMWDNILAQSDTPLRDLFDNFPGSVYSAASRFSFVQVIATARVYQEGEKLRDRLTGDESTLYHVTSYAAASDWVDDYI